MPHVNIWIRKEDWAVWQQLVDKPQWLHDKLVGNPTLKTVSAQFTQTRAGKRTLIDKKIKAIADTPTLADTKTYDYCPHDQLKGFCKHGCK